MPTYHKWLATLRSSIPEIQPDEVQEFIEDEEEFILLDVRDSEETRGGQIPSAQHLPKGFLEIKAESMIPDKDAKLVVYCAGGVQPLCRRSPAKNGLQRRQLDGWRLWPMVGHGSACGQTLCALRRRSRPLLPPPQHPRGGY